MAHARQIGSWVRNLGSWIVATFVVALLGVNFASAQCTDTTSLGKNALAACTASSSKGMDDSAFGSGTLQSNTSGSANTATGVDALNANVSGPYNTATGEYALFKNLTGGYNTATGISALSNNTSGSFNSATGGSALYSNISGANNTAVGFEALMKATGSGNIAIGQNAGIALTTGDNNIEVGNNGLAGESNTIRVGVQGAQTNTFIAGIFGTPSYGARPVVVDSSGHLGVQVSSARYKRDIRNMGDASRGLLKLRPVSFRYKEDPTGKLQYGLIAEEVERVYPNLVTRDSDGKVDGISYETLPAMLINEVQRQEKEIQTLTALARRKDEQLASEQKEINALKAKEVRIDVFSQRLSALEQEGRLAKSQHWASAMR